MSTGTAIVIVAAWLSTGLVSGLWMTRRGYDPLWILVAPPLGLLFVPIAFERVSGRPPVASSEARTMPRADPNAGEGPRVLAGLDGSSEAKQALATIRRLLRPRCAHLVLAEVVHFAATEDMTHSRIDAASRRLGEAPTRIARGFPVHTEVLAGPPGCGLRQFAQRHDIDLLVGGRRGRGPSRLLLGSVSADLVQHSPVPVLAVEPVAGVDQVPSRAVG